MSTETFPAYVVERDSSGAVRGGVQQLVVEQLPPGEVLIESHWSSLNYKDALAATGHAGVVRRFPHVPGVDVAGIVAGIDSAKPPEDFRVGSDVLVTGFDLGAGRWGGWSQLVRVPKDWVIPRPAQLTAREAMVLGTAGFTAAQSVDALLHHGVLPQSGKIVVTGATGGVGCIAVRLLGKLGYHVVAVTGKPAWHDKLKEWGASEILDRAVVMEAGDKPLLSSRWAGVIDTVGGAMLAALVRQTQNQGCVTACGLVGGTELPLTVYPFILRGVTLAGIDSAWCPRERRISLWNKLAGEWRLDDLASIASETTLDSVGKYVSRILQGEIAGRTLVKLR